MSDAAVAAIKYAMRNDEPDTFLRLWFEGNFDALRREWDNVPDEVFRGADPLFESDPTPEETLKKALEEVASNWKSGLVSATEAMITIAKALEGKQ